MFQPLSLPDSFACFTARSIEFFMPRPKSESEPVSGAMTPSLTTFSSPRARVAAGVLPAAARGHHDQDAEHGYQAKELVASLQAWPPSEWDTRLRQPSHIAPPGAVDPCPS